jgi:protein involved in polysaccharide export with SLBB domain
VGEITVLRAIDTAGGFTDFANRKNIELRRATTGEKVRVNWHKAIKDPKLDPQVYPNDQIVVHKRFF